MDMAQTRLFGASADEGLIRTHPAVALRATYHAGFVGTPHG
jgi:hypothetical protein